MPRELEEGAVTKRKPSPFSDYYDNPLKRAGREAQHDLLEARHFDAEAMTFIERLGQDALRVRMDEPMPPRHRAFWDAVGDARGMRVLDVGCGAGWCACRLALLGADVVAIDVSEGMCELTREAARLNHLNPDVRRLSAVRTGFADASFDLVVGQVSLHHLPHPAGIHELCRVLTPDGRAVFMDPIHGSKMLLSLRAVLPFGCEESPGGGALRHEEVREIRKLFERSEITYYGPLARFDRFNSVERL